MRDHRVWLIIQTALQLREEDSSLTHELLKGLFFAAAIIGYNAKIPTKDLYSMHQKLTAEIIKNITQQNPYRQEKSWKPKR